MFFLFMQLFKTNTNNSVFSFFFKFSNTATDFCVPVVPVHNYYTCERKNQSHLHFFLFKIRYKKPQRTNKFFHLKCLLESKTLHKKFVCFFIQNDCRIEEMNKKKEWKFYEKAYKESEVESHICICVLNCTKSNFRWLMDRI